MGVGTGDAALSVVLRDLCEVVKVEPSRIPDVLILEMACSEASIKMDVHRKVNVVEAGDRAEVVISRGLPEYVEGRDFVAHGYVVAKRAGDVKHAVYVSLWGFLVVLHVSPEKAAHFNVMDKVYVKVAKVPQ